MTYYPPIQPTKRKVFVSYHHHGDRAYYEEFAKMFSASYEVLQDNSVEREIDSDNPDYVIRKIREEYITGSSCTIVLCGSQTPWRKFVDWEIKASLDKQHGLIGINLPTNAANSFGKIIVPDRLHDNIETGYAVWCHWYDVASKPFELSQKVELANSRNKGLIKNSRDLRRRNG